MAALPQQHQQQQRPWWQQSPCAIVHGLQQGLHDNLQRAAAAAPWAQQQQQQQQRKQQQQPAPHSAVPMAAASAHASHSGGASSSGSGSKAKAKAAKAAAAAAADGEPVTREELGRATWVFLHTLAAQFPARPTRQQQRDARGVLDALTRIYPCGECARHFGEIVRCALLLLFLFVCFFWGGGEASNVFCIHAQDGFRLIPT
jgi:hypothetical protein